MKTIHTFCLCRVYLIVAFHFQVSYFSPYDFSQFLSKSFSCEFCFLSLVFCTNCHSRFDLVFVTLIYEHLSMFLIGRQTLRAGIVKSLHDDNNIIKNDLLKSLKPVLYKRYVDEISP